MNAGFSCRWTERGPDGTAAVLRLSGGFDIAAAARVREALRKILADQPRAIVLDLAGVAVLDDIALTVFTAFAHTAAGWPGCPVLLAAPAPVRDALERLGIDRGVPVHPDLAAALAAAGALPAPWRQASMLPFGAVAAAEARDLVERACLEWRLGHLVPHARVIATELVGNAVRHGAAPLGLRLTRGEYFLHLAVRDAGPGLPRRLLATEADDHGRGLLLVDALAAGWGTLPETDGKTVWATLRLRPYPVPVISN